MDCCVTLPLAFSKHIDIIKIPMNKELRFSKTQKKLEKFFEKGLGGCFICDRLPKNKFKHWKIIRNNFPYDRLASKHDMLTTLRHVSLESEFNAGEKAELVAIKEKILPKMDYDWIIENLPRKKSVPKHFHLHLLKHK